MTKFNPVISEPHIFIHESGEVDWQVHILNDPRTSNYETWSFSTEEEAQEFYEEMNFMYRN